jgi:hypothetical protein
MQRHIILSIKESSRKKKSMRSRSPHSMYTGGECHVICPEACSMYVRYYLGRLTRCTTMPWPSAATAEFFGSLLGFAACPWLSTWLRRRTVFHSLLFKAILGGCSDVLSCGGYWGVWSTWRSRGSLGSSCYDGSDSPWAAKLLCLLASWALPLSGLLP